MSEPMDHAELVAQVIQEGYHDATSTTLDRAVSKNIVTALRKAGWATPEEVRTIVAAAGGRVSVSDDLVLDPPEELFWERDYRNLATIVRTRRLAPTQRPPEQDEQPGRTDR